MISNLLDKIKGFLSKEAKEQSAIESNIPLITMNDETYNYYKKHVKGNFEIPRLEAEKKMTRNKMLAFEYKRNGIKKWYAYGLLRFMVVNGEVVWIKNHQKPFAVWEKDREKYDQLSKQLDIDVKWL